MSNISFPSITIAYSTLGARLKILTLPDQSSGVDYLVLVQKSNGDVPVYLSKREDVEIKFLNNVGLSYSRNAALRDARGDLLVFMDDDLVLDLDGVRALADRFVRDPFLGFAAGWRRSYFEEQSVPPVEAPLGRFNSGRICAPELMVRPSMIADKFLRFDTAFGLGAQYGLGEEYIFVTDMLKAKIKGVSVPIIVGDHPDESTGQIWDDPALMNARMAMIKRVFGRGFFFMRLAYLWRHRQKVPRWCDRKKFIFGISF
jgi:glycosyltransferase involved in cell wall biosynthesis